MAITKQDSYSVNVLNLVVNPFAFVLKQFNVSHIKAKLFCLDFLASSFVFFLLSFHASSCSYCFSL